jgi:2Fe-2S ferredoxin
VYVQSPWAEHLQTMDSSEHNMLEFVSERRDSSRLACQISMSAELDGIEVHMPDGQH